MQRHTHTPHTERERFSFSFCNCSIFSLARSSPAACTLIEVFLPFSFNPIPNMSLSVCLSRSFCFPVVSPFSNEEVNRTHAAAAPPHSSAQPHNTKPESGFNLNPISPSAHHVRCTTTLSRWKTKEEKAPSLLRASQRHWLPSAVGVWCLRVHFARSILPIIQAGVKTHTHTVVLDIPTEVREVERRTRFKDRRLLWATHIIRDFSGTSET